MSALQTIHGIDLVREQIEAFNAGDWEALKRTMAANAVYDELATKITLHGPENIIAGMKRWRAAYPDLKGTVTRYMGDEQSMAIELTWEGTFKNDMETPAGIVKATGTHDRLFAAQFYAFEDGRIVSLHHYFDLASAIR